MSISASLNSNKNDFDAMTDNNEDIKITINIGNLFDVKLNIKRASEKYYRDGAKKVNEMWKQLSEIDGDKSSVNTKLAVIALKFASQLYRTMEKASETVSANERKLADTSKMLDEFEHQLDDILINTK